MAVPGGCLVQVSTSFITSIGENGAEALTYVPGVIIEDEQGGEGCFLADDDRGSDLQ
jgi:hypothetical protein